MIYAHQAKQQGFTLVELAIVMIIIGLLIGGVLKGQQLIENAKVSAVISEVKSYQVALLSFRSTYGSLPGDMRRAQSRLSGCGPTDNFCTNGNGNGLIADLGTGESSRGKGNSVWWTSTLRDWEEPIQAWKHMALADLITGIETNADTDPGELTWGSTHPASSLRGGYELFYDADTTNRVSAHFLRMSNLGIAPDTANGAVGTIDGAAPASPKQAAQIDRKLDDGLPISGSVMSNYGVGAGGDTTCIASGGIYAETENGKNCAMFFLIDG